MLVTFLPLTIPRGGYGWPSQPLKAAPPKDRLFSFAPPDKAILDNLPGGDLRDLDIRSRTQGGPSPDIPLKDRHFWHRVPTDWLCDRAITAPQYSADRSR